MDLNFHLRFLPLVVVSALVIAGSLFYTQSGQSQSSAEVPKAHDPHDPNHWYPIACCNLRDCYPLDPSEYKETHEGIYIYPSSEFIPIERTQISPDGRVHRCSMGASRSSRTIGHMESDSPYPEDSPFHGAACVFIPPKGF